MRLNIEFLQTGGVPLTNDLMDQIMEAIKLYDVVGAVVGHMTILSGCESVGGSVNPGVVAINNEVLFFEGGTVSTNVFVYEESFSEIFEDQSSKVLVKKRSVRFGNATAPNLFVWADFVKLKTIKEIQALALAAAPQTLVDDLKDRVEALEVLTAPIATKMIRWFFQGELADIPAGWEVDNEMAGFVPIGVDPSDDNFDEPGNKWGEKKHSLTIAEMPSHAHQMNYQLTIGTQGKANSDAYHRVHGNYTNRLTELQGGGQSHNNIQPSIAGYWIKPI